MDAKQENNMKDPTTAPTADLLAEWGKLAAIAKHTNYARDTTFDKVEFEGKIAAIAAELDRRCSEANMASDGNGNLKTPCSIELPITEFCLLCDWLLLKGGNG